MIIDNSIRQLEGRFGSVYGEIRRKTFQKRISINGKDNKNIFLKVRLRKTASEKD